MARDEPGQEILPARCVAEPQIRLFGEIDELMLDQFLEQLGEVPEDDPVVAVEISTPGGDAEFGRRLVLEVEVARRKLQRRLIFIGKTQVYSAGVTLMSAFPRPDRYLTPDTVLLIHCRQLDKTIDISGPMRASLPKIEAVREQVELGIRLEEENFRRLIEGSRVTMEELSERALHNWYVRADDALQWGLVQGLVMPPTDDSDQVHVTIAENGGDKCSFH